MTVRIGELNWDVMERLLLTRHMAYGRAIKCGLPGGTISYVIDTANQRIEK